VQPTAANPSPDLPIHGHLITITPSRGADTFQFQSLAAGFPAVTGFVGSPPHSHSLPPTGRPATACPPKSCPHRLWPPFFRLILVGKAAETDLLALGASAFDTSNPHLSLAKSHPTPPKRIPRLSWLCVTPIATAPPPKGQLITAPPAHRIPGQKKNPPTGGSSHCNNFSTSSPGQSQHFVVAVTYQRQSATPLGVGPISHVEFIVITTNQFLSPVKYPRIHSNAHFHRFPRSSHSS